MSLPNDPIRTEETQQAVALAGQLNPAGSAASHFPDGASVFVGHAHEGVYVRVAAPGREVAAFVDPDGARHLADLLQLAADRWEE